MQKEFHYNANNYKLLSLQISTINNINATYQKDLSNLQTNLQNLDQKFQENSEMIENLKNEILAKKQDFASRKLKLEHKMSLL